MAVHHTTKGESMMEYPVLNKMREEMTEEKAKEIFKNINSTRYKVIKKTMAIDFIVDNMITTGLTVKDFLSALKWLQTAMPWRRNSGVEE